MMNRAAVDGGVDVGITAAVVIVLAGTVVVVVVVLAVLAVMAALIDESMVVSFSPIGCITNTRDA